MKQIFIGCLTLASVLATLEHSYESYAPHHVAETFDLIDLGEHLDLKSEYKAEYPAGLLFGHGYIDGLEHHSGDSLKGYVSGPTVHTISSHIASSFEHNLLSPELPHVVPEIKTSIASPRYTKTPTATYEVKENTYEPIPIPKITTATAVQSPKPGQPLPTTTVEQNQQIFPPVQLGSGSLGVVKLSDGNLAVGSGSLGYGVQAQQPQPQQGKDAPFQSGGLQVIPAPQFKDASSYAQKEQPTSHENFDINTLHSTDFSDFFKS